MPEHPEIRAFVNFINVVAEQTVFTRIMQFAVGEQKEELRYPKNFTLVASQRGKQMRFQLSPHLISSQNERDSQTDNLITIGFGLTGYFSLTSSLDK